MSFTSLQTGGLYKHNHGYAIRYGEYYGTSNHISLEDTTAIGTSSWKVPERSGSININHSANQSSSSGSVVCYTAYAATRLNSDNLNVPFIAVYFWRRTA